MSAQKELGNQPDKKYYIFDKSASITPVKDYKFNKQEIYLKLLVESECFLKNLEFKNKKIKLDQALVDLGFKWDFLAESGHMRQLPSATTILEAIGKYIWSIADKFGNEQDLPIHRISGGELFDVNNYELKKQIAIISKGSMYGTNQYNVVANNRKQILRYSACTQKLVLAREINLSIKDLPIGIFELSKSYRFEKENELQLGKRVRNFHLPELHILNDGLEASLRKALSAHAKILNEIGSFDSECELFCSVSNDFFENHQDYLKIIAESIDKPFLIAVYNKGANCGNGIKIDIEYKVFDTLKCPLEISTFQVDDGTSDFSFGVKYKDKSGLKKPISTIHTVFFGSLERAAYFFIDRAIKKETKSGFRPLPFWAAPIQVRVITDNNEFFKEAKKLTEDLNLLNFRADFDDRKISLSAKKKNKDLKYIPYLISFVKNTKGLPILILENQASGIIKKEINKNEIIKMLRAEKGNNISVPLYTPLLLSKRKSLET